MDKKREILRNLCRIGIEFRSAVTAIPLSGDVSMSKFKTGISLATAAAFVALTGLSVATPAAAADDNVKCYGVNSCKGQSDCKSGNHECKGQNSCKGQGFKEESAAKCKADHGSTTAPK
jgi:uncharacterized membrane protein